MKQVLLAALYAAWLLLFFLCAPANFLLYMLPGRFPPGNPLYEAMARIDSVDPHVHWRWVVLIGSFVVFALVRKLHKRKTVHAVLCVLVAGLIGTFYDFDFMRSGGSAIVGLFTCIAAALFVFIAASDALSSGLAEWLTEYRGERWVKEIEYVYLLLGSVGVAASIFRLEKSRGAGDLTLFDWFGPLVLSIALALRLVKTRAEVNEWNKLATWKRVSGASGQN
jgi:hypothetical protein